MPRGEAKTHGYYNASAECWSVYTEVLAVEYENAPLFGRVHQLTVDTYATQHAGGPHPDKSVDVHLVGLHLVLARDVSPPEVPRQLQRLASSISQWPHFTPPEERARSTVFDVASAASVREHEVAVRKWAREVWSTWRAHHDAIAELAVRCYAGPKRDGGDTGSSSG